MFLNLEEGGDLFLQDVGSHLQQYIFLEFSSLIGVNTNIRINMLGVHTGSDQGAKSTKDIILSN
jgi:hypothetical protein